MEARHITVRGLRLRWEEGGGDGFPVVFIHGIPTSPALWRHVVPLVDGARCLAFERVRYGQSIPEGRRRDISVARQSAYLLGWMEAVTVERGRADAAPVRRPL